MLLVANTCIWLLIFLACGLFPLQISAMLLFFIWYVAESLCILVPQAELAVLVQSSVFFLVICCGLIRQGGLSRAVTVVLALFFVLVCIVAGGLYGYTSVHGRFGMEQFAGVFYTNAKEAQENFYIYVGSRGIGYALLLVAVVLLPFLLPRRIWQGHRSLLPRLRRIVPLFSLCLLCAAIMLFVFGGGRPHVLEEMTRSCLEQGRNSQQRPSLPVLPGGEAKDMTILLVIGESASTTHMSAYNYYRPTTPWMEDVVSRGEGILFQNAFSAHSYTAQTVPLMLSDVHQYRPGDMALAPTIINRLRAAGYGTWWISNQERKGLHVSTISTLAEEAEHCFFTGEKESDLGLDDALLPQVLAAVNSRGTPGKFIVCHLMGSHTDYSKRYPASFLPDLGTISSSLWGDVSPEKQQRIDAYDRSIAFTDDILRQLVSGLPRDERIALIYVSDHGEGVTWESFHDSSKVLRHDIFSIPMFIWFSEAFRQEEADVVDRLRSIASAYFTNDRVADVIRLLASGHGNLEELVSRSPENALIRYGEASVAGLDMFRTREHVRRLSAMLGKRLYLNSANSLEKLRVGMQSGFDGVEMSVGYDSSRKTFFVDWPRRQDALPLERFLDMLRQWRQESVALWLRLSPQDGVSAGELLASLDALDAAFAISRRTVLELPAGGELFAACRDRGWNVVCRLPQPEAHDVGGREVCRKLARIRQDSGEAGLALDAATQELVERACPEALADMPLYLRFLSPDDISTQNTITSTLTRRHIAGDARLRGVAISLETDEDRQKR